MMKSRRHRSIDASDKDLSKVNDKMNKKEKKMKVKEHKIANAKHYEFMSRLTLRERMLWHGFLFK